MNVGTVVTSKKKRPRTERRKLFRHVIFKRFPVVVYPNESSRPEHGEILGIGVVTDISRAGIGIILEKPVKRGSQVVLVLNADSPDERQLQASAIWSGVLPSLGRILKPNTEATEFFRIGLRFDPQDEEQNESIEELIKKG